MNAIDAVNLTKSFAGRAVLRDLAIHVPQGTIYGLLGSNGAGKSTLLSLLLGFLLPDSGSVQLFGRPVASATPGRVGYLPERLTYHRVFTGREYLRALGQFSGLGGAALDERVGAMLGLVGLASAADRRLGSYSKGMLQQVGLAQALIHEPDLLLIDEPTAGLDPAGQQELLELLAGLRGRGHTVLLTTHYLDEAEQLCDTVGVLHNGAIAAETSTAALRGPSNHIHIRVVALGSELSRQLMQRFPGVRCERELVEIRHSSQALQAEVVRALLDADVAIVALHPIGRPIAEFVAAAVRGDWREPAAAPPVPAPSPTAAHQLLPGDTLLSRLLQPEEPPRSGD